MSFLYPAFLFAAVAIAVPIALHLLRRDVAPEVAFTAVRLLRRSPVERTRRRRLRDIVLLAARIVAVLLLAAAFARPYIPTAAATRLRIVAIDRSFSMSAPGRFAGALDLARSAIDGAGSSQRVAVVAFDERADVLAEPGSAADARAALDGLAAGFGATRYRPLIERALDLAAGGACDLVVITDLGQPGWEGEAPVALPAGWTVEVRDAGDERDNVAVTAVHRDSDRVLATIRNAGSKRYDGDVHVDVDGRLVGRASATIEPGASSDVSIPVQVPRTGSLAVAIDDETGFQPDNVRFLVLDPSAERRVLTVIGQASARVSGLFLARALDASTGSERSFASTTIMGSRVSRMSVEELATHRAVALLSTRGLDRRGREAIAAYVRGGGGLFVAAAADVDPALLSSAFGWRPPLAPVERSDRPLSLAATDLRHPIFRPFGALAANLGQVRFDRVWRVSGEGWEVAARFADGSPALLERTEGSGRVVLFASDVDRRWNDFPLHPSFVPFVIEAVSHVAGVLQPAASYTPATVPPGVGPQPGVFRVSPTRVVAVNVDPRESTTTRMTQTEFQEMIVRGPAGAPARQAPQASLTEAGQSYWRYGLLLMLAALVVESFVGRR